MPKPCYFFAKIGRDIAEQLLKDCLLWSSSGKKGYIRFKVSTSSYHLDTIIIWRFSALSNKYLGVSSRTHLSCEQDTKS